MAADNKNSLGAKGFQIRETGGTEVAPEAPASSNKLVERIEEHHSSSPADSGGDFDAQWEEVNTSGSESVFGDNPTPDQSNVEENAEAMGMSFEDNQPLDFIKKMEKRDRDRFELNEDSKSADDMI